MAIVLVGYRCCGKTTLGRKLADRLWQDFFDADAELEKRAGRPVADIFASQGEPAFRDLEEQVLAGLLVKNECVISLGGGVVEREANRAALSGSAHSRIYLRCDPAELARRMELEIAAGQIRPSLTGRSPVEEIGEVLARRHPLYQAVATAELDVTNLTADEALARVVRLT